MGQFLAIAALVLQASATVQEAGAKKVELEIAKREEASAARTREVDRRERVRTIISAQAAEAAAKGLQLTGSVANISIVDAKLAGQESFIDRANTRARIAALSRRGSSITRVANIRAAGTILTGTQRIRDRG